MGARSVYGPRWFAKPPAPDEPYDFHSPKIVPSPCTYLKGLALIEYLKAHSDPSSELRQRMMLRLAELTLKHLEARDKWLEEHGLFAAMRRSQEKRDE